MATEDTATEELRKRQGVQFQELKGRLFETILAGATLVGIVSLLVLFLYIAVDALGPLSAGAQWYLLYFGTLVAPTGALVLYLRRHPAARATSTKMFAAVGGSLVASLVIFAVLDALSPYDALIYAVFAGGLPLLVGLYGWQSSESRLTGPAIPVAALGGIALGALARDAVLPTVSVVAQWIAYVVVVTLPITALVGALAARRWTRRRGVITAGLSLAATLAVVGLTLTRGMDPSLWVVLCSGFVVPVGYVFGTVALSEEEGRIGALGPFVVAGGVVLGAVLERQLAVTGLDSYLGPTLLLNVWDGLTASNAGVYPQIVGSIVLVGFMAVMAFPVGIGAAIYLEEYAPDTGIKGRLATLLEVNISNLAGVPSVVYGLLGLALFRNVLGLGPGLVVAASATLGLLILPIVIVSAQEAIRSVPDSLRMASYGMGASRWQTLRNVVFPEAVPGILTGTILALGRAIGETAPLVILGVATTTYAPPEGLFSSATALPLQIFASAGNAQAEFRTGVVAAAAIVLLTLMLLMNATAIVIRNKYERDGEL